MREKITNLALHTLLCKETSTLIDFVNSVCIISDKEDVLQSENFVSEKQSKSISPLNRGIIGGVFGLGVGFILGIGKLAPTCIGAILGVGSYYISHKRNDVLSLNEKFENVSAYKEKVIKQIELVNEDARKKWNSMLQGLVDLAIETIEKQTWDDEKQAEAVRDISVYKSLIISDYIYTDKIYAIKEDDNFRVNLEREFESWKKDLINLIENTSQSQWNDYFSKVYTE